VLPALLSLNCVDRIDLATTSNSIDISIPSEKKGEIFYSYREALTKAKKGLAYISLPNSLHAEWVEVALQEGFHVVVDKPAFINAEDGLRLSELAKLKGLCLSEATVWPFQSQIQLAQEQIQSTDSDIKLIQATFSFPPFDLKNFRNSKDLGGGAFNDLCIYALTPGRVFFEAPPDEIIIRSSPKRSGCEVDTAFNISASYAGGRVFQGFFSFETEYKNSMRLLGSDIAIEIEPAFTSGSDDGYIQIKRKNQLSKLAYSANDGFSTYFQVVMESISKGDWSEWDDILAHDSENIKKARKGIAL
jgi:predicted dehydrogenase